MSDMKRLFAWFSFIYLNILLKEMVVGRFRFKEVRIYASSKACR